MTTPNAPVRRQPPAAQPLMPEAALPRASVDAINNPVSTGPKVLESANFPVGQKPPVIMPEVGLPDREQVIVALDTPLVDEYADALKFNEEPLEIMIHPSGEKDAPLVVDCWVNGKGAEVFMNGAWRSFGWLPVGKRCVTKRKYVELLLNSKIDTIHTDVEDATVENPANKINRVTSSKCLLQIIQDRNPLGVEWLRRIMASTS